MKLNITKPLVVFDLETTGLDLAKARIIQISYIKVQPDGEEQRADFIINPETAIPQEITELTGISNDDVVGKPTFKEIAPMLAETFKGCDFAGFNSNHFDIPLLAEEFLRAGIDFDFSHSYMIDAQAIFRKMERRNLASAYRFYCGRKMEDDFQAHRADQDTEATYRVLMTQLDHYAPGAQPEDPEKVLQNDMQALDEFSRDSNNIDFAGRMVWGEKKDAKGKPVLDENGQPKTVALFNFGKYKGREVAEVLRIDPGYYSWIMGNDFTLNTKQELTRIKLAALMKKS